ncbi:MAG TPA: DMT family protein [Candidatus Alistipes avicola]|uniref:DMT family protein n=1 Tax=Candidatus Alistipes avicola TaxID=2838432 RepID=A0A9D2L2E8_9BACT|nr:DMT family protein [uncultured Alistipes sp.]HJA98541.1 DMT family protein [Candidatus Alistipes avicola]
MTRAITTILLLICSNAFMTLAWYGQIAFKSRIQRLGLVSIILLSWGIALFEYCFQIPANRIGSNQYAGPFSIWELKVIQEVISLLVFTVFAVVFMKSDTLRWNHLAGFVCLILAVYFIFKK